MYRINKSENNISKLKECKFGELGFRERDNLQEWIAKNPDILGEELLIIQKEFSGFDDTNERLDLLALDKEGDLVIIENKLDDSGKDVVWQALKYTSYCSTLTKIQIVDIYQRYLDAYENGGDAISNLVDFIQAEDFDSLSLNADTNQRIVFIANNYRKEVTSTVLWLLEQQLRIQCFKATPYSMGDELFLQIDQIIPTPEAKEFMIGIGIKKQESKQIDAELKNRHILRKDYWELVLNKVQNSESDLFNNVNPTKSSWMSAGSGISLVTFIFTFLKRAARVELYISRTNTDENKFIFDELKKRQNEIESVFGEALEWRRLDDKKASIIQIERSFDGFNKKVWDESSDFLVDTMIRLEKAIKPHLQSINTKLKANG